MERAPKRPIHLLVLTAVLFLHPMRLIAQGGAVQDRGTCVIKAHINANWDPSRHWVSQTRDAINFYGGKEILRWLRDNPTRGLMPGYLPDTKAQCMSPSPLGLENDMIRFLGNLEAGKYGVQMTFKNGASHALILEILAGEDKTIRIADPNLRLYNSNIGPRYPFFLRPGSDALAKLYGEVMPKHKYELEEMAAWRLPDKINTHPSPEPGCSQAGASRLTLSGGAVGTGPGRASPWYSGAAVRNAIRGADLGRAGEYGLNSLALYSGTVLAGYDAYDAMRNPTDGSAQRLVSDVWASGVTAGGGMYFTGKCLSSLCMIKTGGALSAAGYGLVGLMTNPITVGGAVALYAASDPAYQRFQTQNINFIVEGNQRLLEQHKNEPWYKPVILVPYYSSAP